MITKLFTQIKKRKFTSGIAFLLIVGIGYWGYGSLFSQDGVVRYASAQVQKGTLIASISGSGQVSASNQVDVKPRTSGEITAVYVTPGKEVSAGQAIAQLDARDAQRAVRDAQTALETAKLDLEKAQAPLDELTALQAENALTSAKDNLEKLKFTQTTDYQKAQDNLKKAYEDGFNTVSDAFLKLPGVMTGLDDTFFDEDDFESYQWNIDWYLNQVSLDNRDKGTRYRDDVTAAYNKARTAYTKNFDDYKAASRTSDTQTIESLITETYETTKLIAEAVKVSNNYIDFVQDGMERYDRTIPSLLSTHQSNIDSYTGTTNSHLLSLLSIQTSLKDSRDAIQKADQNNPRDLAAAEASVKEKEASLKKTKSGPDSLDIRSKQITIQQREDALLTAQQALADTTVRAPFAGVIAKVTAKKGDNGSTGTAVATLITKQKIAEVSLNEIDAAQVKQGQKVTLTFDAVPDLTITGQVVETDSLGTVSQGVVTYNMKIGFDTQDERIKPAMSVSAAIITNAKPDVLLVPNSAIKSQGGISYVEVPSSADTNIAMANVSGAVFQSAPERRTIEVGTANDESTEIISGLNEGDLVVTRTIQPTAATQTQQQSGGLSIPGLNTGGGGTRTGGNAVFQR